MVQLPQVRQRSGDVVPAWMARVALQQLLEAVGLQVTAHLACCARHDRCRRCNVVRPLAERCGNSLKNFRARLAADLDQESWLSPSISSVSARSNPDSAFGPVFIETQKQVPPACPQFTATMKALRRRIA